ncbi:hypothetical protein LOD99_6965 [Oopsacas minuta]|uniref:Uncharacterized protein n=1 Tax=Oopsacas minuta TaxID=111878 RepID=A0AAV7JJN5_9METZ|nr:hypothetical protein LOD99_6965 [Oopsacas minuta]
MDSGSAEGDEGDKEEVKLQLHDITERMSKLLYCYEGDKEYIPEENNDGELEMKDGLLDALTDFHEMANTRENLLETLMDWFDGSSRILANTDAAEDPEESWCQIENEMQRVLTAVSSLQQHNRRAEIERKLLGVVLKEDDIEKIEEIRGEYNNRKLKVEKRQDNTKRQVEQVICTTDERGSNEYCDVTVTDYSLIARIKREINKQICVKEVQIDCVEEDGDIIQEIIEEMETPTISKDNNIVIYKTASTQTNTTIPNNNWYIQQNSQTNMNIQTINNQTKTQTANNQAINKQTKTQTANNQAINKQTKTQTANNQTLNKQTTNTGALEISDKTENYFQDLIQVNISKNTNIDVTEEVNNNTNYTQVNTSIREESSFPIIHESHTDTDINEMRESRTIIEQKLPKIKCQQQQQQRHRKHRVNRMRILKSNAGYKVNVKPDEGPRNKIYMHLPVATTCNTGLGLNPPLTTIPSSLVTTPRKGMFIFPPSEIVNRGKIQSTPVQLQLNSDYIAKNHGYKPEVLNLHLQYKSYRKRAMTIYW